MAVGGPFHNFQRPAGPSPDPLNQLAGIAGIGPEQLQTRKTPLQSVQDQLGAISVLQVCRMYYRGQEQAYGVHCDVALATGDLLAGVIAPRPPFSVVFTD